LSGSRRFGNRPIRLIIATAIARSFAMKIALILAAAGLLLAAPALAQKPPQAGGPSKAVEKDVGKGGGYRISSSDRDVIRRYYGDQFRAGNCPPGLAKKNNGCLPPGQAKKWGIGQRLPRDLVYYDLPRDLYSRLRPPGDGYKYIRTGADILLIAVGTMMVIDAIEDLNQMGRGS
jgi:Ni/Co efflux regulator RcnB